MCYWNKIPKGWRVYQICLDGSRQHPKNKIPPDWSDDEFIEESERQRLVYTLEGFQNNFNASDVNENGSYIRIINIDKTELDPYECKKCGFHIGLDATYIDQVDEIEIDCPSCKATITTKE